MKTAYPTASDWAGYLAGSGLFPETTVTTGAANATQTVGSTAEMRVGDTLWFGSALVTRTVASVASATSVVLSSAVTTTTAERVVIFRTPFDLATGVAAGIQAFEADAGRVFLATADTTRYFDPPSGPQGMLDLKADLAAVTTVTVAGATKTENTDFVLRPLDAAAEGKPYSLIQFSGRFYAPVVFSQIRSIAITGRWAYASSATGMPEDVWLAMLAKASLIRLPQLSLTISGGVTDWKEADISESYGGAPLAGVADLWRAEVAQALYRYRRVMVG